MHSCGCLTAFRSKMEVSEVKKPVASLKISAMAAVLTTMLTTKGMLIVRAVSRDIGYQGLQNVNELTGSGRCHLPHASDADTSALFSVRTGCVAGLFQGLFTVSVHAGSCDVTDRDSSKASPQSLCIENETLS
uniref:Polyketide synthase n=1 Tax=Peronospora matthiolae TaxID=2874970 RepID=A0AAV1V348_9STRA